MEIITVAEFGHSFGDASMRRYEPMPANLIFSIKMMPSQAVDKLPFGRAGVSKP
jgi:hypothetical protein